MGLKEFEGKVALVTGAASGIGEATAHAFADAGATVIVADIQDEQGRAVADAIKSKGGHAHYVHCDVRSETSIQGMIEEIVTHFGRLDCAFNNAGLEGSFTPMLDQTNEMWDAIIDTDLRGTWLCMKYEITQMLKQGGGAIVNCGSLCSLVGVAGLSSYVAAKHGIVGLTKAAALDYSTQNIRVNAVCPGSILTAAAERNVFSLPPEQRDQMEAYLMANQPIGRWGKSDEIAAAVLWLCSPGASLMLGHAMAVDGGWTAK